MSDVVHVAVAVILRGQDILVSLRPDHVHQGGLWEFPGGKVESCESVCEALRRELNEELGIIVSTEPEALEPLIRIQHDYGDKAVLLDVWKVLGFSGEAHGKEGQAVQWVSASQLDTLDFPAANQPIVKACQLSDRLAITPVFSDLSELEDYLGNIANKEVDALLLRQPQLSFEDYRAWYGVARVALEGTGTSLVLHGNPEVLSSLGAEAVHMPAAIGMKYLASPDRPAQLSMSCHNLAEIQHAQEQGLDFVTLSPVKTTTSHPDTEPMGWTGFQNLSEKAKIPVYALGGMTLRDVTLAKSNGAQGIAGISCWN